MIDRPPPSPVIRTSDWVLLVGGAVGGVVGAWAGPHLLFGAGWGRINISVVGLVTLYGVLIGAIPGILGGRLAGLFDDKVLRNGDLRPAEVVGGFLLGVVGSVVGLPFMGVAMFIIEGGP
jgi:hypothetical protein